VFSSGMRVLGLRVFLGLLGFLLGAVFCGQFCLFLCMLPLYIGEPYAFFNKIYCL
jgi:hypothetical protein